MKLRYLPNLEVKIGLDMMVIIKERQQQKRVFERKLKAAEGASVRKKVLPTAGDTSIVMIHDGENADLDM